MFEKVYGTTALLLGLVALGCGAVAALDTSGLSNRAEWKAHPGRVGAFAKLSNHGNSVPLSWDDGGPQEGNMPVDTLGLAAVEPHADKPTTVLVFQPSIGSRRVCMEAFFEPCRRDHTSWAGPGFFGALGLFLLAYGAKVLRSV